MVGKTRQRPPLLRRLSQVCTNDTADFRLVVASYHPAGAIELQGPVALSIFFLFVSLFAAQNDGCTFSPTRSAHSHRLSNTPPPTDTTIVWLVVAYLHQEAATQDRCSARLSIFPWGPFRRPKQGDQMQRAQARAPGASIRLMGSHGAAIQFRGGCEALFRI